MQTKEYIQAQFDFLHTALLKITEGLTKEELSWQPGAANSIGFLMLHIARSEDNNISTRLQGKPQVWITGKWYEKFGLAPDETSNGWSEEKLSAFKFPGLKTMLDYAGAVQSETDAYLARLAPRELNRTINVSYLGGDVPVGRVLARAVIHISGHIGEMSYIRGLKRGLNK